MSTTAHVIEVIGPDYRTPLTDLPTTTFGSARIRHVKLATGYYPAEGTYGHEFLRIKGGKLTTTELQRRGSERGGGWHTWMTDDWLHWNAMRERVESLPGDTRTLVCAGLGLGLMLHHLAEWRPDIERITVVELDPDVIGLIAPTLPDDPRVELVNADWYRYIETHPAPDAVLWDLAVGDHAETRGQLIRGEVMTLMAWPDVHLSQFGIRLPRPGPGSGGFEAHWTAGDVI